MGDIILQVLKDIGDISMQEPFIYLTATVLLGCVIAITKRLSHI